MKEKETTSPIPLVPSLFTWTLCVHQGGLSASDGKKETQMVSHSERERDGPPEPPPGGTTLHSGSDSAVCWNAVGGGRCSLRWILQEDLESETWCPHYSDTSQYKQLL